ncbi:Cyclin-D-binding Myb-like transcription factor 1 [Phlyctochytrium planicorne]|nr:Cyclin-D-binding Myb-like transcription factor 1 [Phlyctochytrium planicorne]
MNSFTKKKKKRPRDQLEDSTKASHSIPSVPAPLKKKRKILKDGTDSSSSLQLAQSSLSQTSSNLNATTKKKSCKEKKGRNENLISETNRVEDISELIRKKKKKPRITQEKVVEREHDNQNSFVFQEATSASAKEKHDKQRKRGSISSLSGDEPVGQNIIPAKTSIINKNINSLSNSPPSVLSSNRERSDSEDNQNVDGPSLEDVETATGRFGTIEIRSVITAATKYLRENFGLVEQIKAILENEKPPKKRTAEAGTLNSLCSFVLEASQVKRSTRHIQNFLRSSTALKLLRDHLSSDPVESAQAQLVRIHSKHAGNYRRDENGPQEEQESTGIRKGIFTKAEREAVAEAVRAYLASKDIPESDVHMLFKSRVPTREDENNPYRGEDYRDFFSAVNNAANLKRTTKQVNEYLARVYSKDRSLVGTPWSPEEESRLVRFVDQFGQKWARIEREMSRIDCKEKYRLLMSKNSVTEKLRLGLWTQEEELKMARVIKENYSGRDPPQNAWESIAKLVGSRTARQCRIKYASIFKHIYLSNEGLNEAIWKDEDSRTLLHDILDQNAGDETEVEWARLSQASKWGVELLKQRWIQFRSHVPDQQEKSFAGTPLQL